ncbi:hypothetical protein HN371_14770 [Candidatus Poribacteria bacterium]|jgi:TolB protein|nr:hypothetical protein [Candidatus Poribacteria bacterium]MBT5533349.1 hypothetical protein [Candidatus Poribacteria bacterium]MBT5713256.1 hypothetical protein [Candidatus Poribacteria bacterium]MBT7101381.1 hypothetical protein [Candidatus Poribacteria bacterium]MBT7806997.1 hypothetical protein [Candidatus Poribacteria bacterium]
MNADGSDIRRLSEGSEMDGVPCWSPDGQWIAFQSGHNPHEDIYAIRPDGSALTRLTRDEGDDWAPDWSPDGRTIAFTNGRGPCVIRLVDVLRLLPGSIDRPPSR